MNNILHPHVEDSTHPHTTYIHILNCRNQQDRDILTVEQAYQVRGRRNTNGPDPLDFRMYPNVV